LYGEKIMKKWFYHSDFPKGKIFETGSQPDGCVDHPDDIGSFVKKTVLKKQSKKKKMSVSDGSVVDTHEIE